MHDKLSSRTAALGLLQCLVLEIRELERKTVLDAYSVNLGAQQTLVDSFKSTLETSTASTGGEGDVSEAVISENERRVEFWQALFSQMNDEEMRSSSSQWTSTSAVLTACTDAGDFEEKVVKAVNKLVCERRSSSGETDVLPPALAESSRSGWASTHWDHIEALLEAATFSHGITTDINAQLDVIIDELAHLLPLIEPETDDEPIENTVSRGDTLAWIFERLATAFCGTYMEEFDDELALRLSTTVEDISRRVSYEISSAKLREAAGHLSSVLERINPRTGRYSQVDDIVYASYDASELKSRLAKIDNSTSVASHVIAKAAMLGDFLTGRDLGDTIAFANTIHQAQTFATFPAEFKSRLETELSDGTQNPTSKTQALRALLRVEEEDITSWPSFSSLSAYSELVTGPSSSEQDLIGFCYSMALKRLAGKLHFVSGMAQESEYNPNREMEGQKTIIKSEYNEGAANGSDEAYNNLLCNSFFQARSGSMSFDVARAQVLSPFEDLSKTDTKAAENLDHLLSNNIPVSRYEILPPPDPDDEIGNSIMFEEFISSIRTLVKRLEAATEAASSGSNSIETLRQILGDRLDVLANSLDRDDIRLEDVTEMVTNVSSETDEKIRTCSVFSNLGGFDTILNHIFTGTNLQNMPFGEFEDLVVALGDTSDVKEVLFQGLGNTIFYQTSIGNPNVCRFVQKLLPRVVDVRVAELQASNSPLHEVSLIRRIARKAAKDVGTLGDDPSNADLQQSCLSMTNAIMFDQVSATSLEPRDLFTEDERKLSGLCGESSTNTALYETDDNGTTVVTPCFSWRDRLTQQVLLSFLQRAASSGIVSGMATLRESFWSPSQDRSTQDPLQLAEDEVDKIEGAKNALFDASNIDNLALHNSSTNMFSTHVTTYCT